MVYKILQQLGNFTYTLHIQMHFHKRYSSLDTCYNLKFHHSTMPQFRTLKISSQILPTDLQGDSKLPNDSQVNF